MMKTGRTILLVLAVLTLLAFPLNAAADSADDLIREGMKLEEAGKLRAAIKMYERATRADPGSAYAYIRLGCALRLNKKTKKAERKAAKASRSQMQY